MKKVRIEWIDIAKYICIMCVMGSHLESMTRPLFRSFSPFYLTLFFFCSGYVYKEQKSFIEFFSKKVMQLFIPWLVFSNLNIFLSQIISFNAHNSLITELYWNFLQIRGKGDGLWFIAALFVAYIPFYFVIHWFNKKDISSQRIFVLFVFTAFISFLSNVYKTFMESTFFPWNSANLPWHIEYIGIAMFYMVLGYLFKILFEPKFNQYNTKIFRIGIWVFYLCVNFFFNYLVTVNPVVKIFTDYILQLLGISAVISVCKVIRPNKYILYIGENTLLCFAFHGKVYSLGQTILKKVLGDIYYYILNNIFLSSVLAVLFTIGISIILILPIYIVNRYFPILVGRSNKNGIGMFQHK